MANIKVDTQKLSSAATRINELANQYLDLIDNMFDDMNNLIKKGWAGNAADRYKHNLKLEREFFNGFGKDIKNYANELSNHANAFDKKIKRWEIE